MKEVYESTGKPLIDTDSKDLIKQDIDDDPEKKLVKADILYMSRDAVM